MERESIFQLISRMMLETGIRCVLIGGFAVNYYKVSRQTADVDLMIASDDFEKGALFLKKTGFREEQKSDVFARFTAPETYFLDVDYMFVQRETLNKILKECEEADIGGEKFKVPSLYHLMALKMHAIKYNSKREYRDLPDIVELIKSNKVDIKSKRFTQLCSDHGSKEIYDKISAAVRPLRGSGE